MVKVLAGLKVANHRKKGFSSLSRRPFQQLIILNNGRGQYLPWEWRLEDHLSGMLRVWSRWLLGFLPGLGFHAQYTLTGCITWFRKCKLLHTRETPSTSVALTSLQDCVWADAFLPISCVSHLVPQVNITRDAHPNLRGEDLCKLERKGKNK